MLGVVADAVDEEDEKDRFSVFFLELVLDFASFFVEWEGGGVTTVLVLVVWDDLPLDWGVSVEGFRRLDVRRVVDALPPPPPPWLAPDAAEATTLFIGASPCLRRVDACTRTTGMLVHQLYLLGFKNCVVE